MGRIRFHGVVHSMNRVTLDRTQLGHHRWSAATAVGSKRTLCVALVREPSFALGQTTQQRTMRVAYIAGLVGLEALFFDREALLFGSEGLFCPGGALLLTRAAVAAVGALFANGGLELGCARAIEARPASYATPCLHIDHMTVASLRAIAITAMRRPRFSAIAHPQTTSGSFGFVLHIDQTACTSSALR